MQIGDRVRLTIPSSGAHLTLARLAANRLADRLGLDDGGRAALHDVVGSLWDAVTDETDDGRVTLAFALDADALSVYAIGPRGREEGSVQVAGPGGPRR